MRVIGAGFGRTGTLSLKVALERLGADPCYHMREVFEYPSHADGWEAALRGEPVDWETMLGGYEATVDWPGCTFYERLMDAYPEAKVLLSVREPKRWYESTRDSIYAVHRATSGSRLARAALPVAGLFAPAQVRTTRMINTLIWRYTFDGRFEDERYAVAVFKRHNEEVRRRVPASNLLVYEVSEGWGPLCEFLEVEVPDEPFPHLNDAADFKKTVRRSLAAALAVPVALALATGLVLLRLRRRQRARGVSEFAPVPRRS